MEVADGVVMRAAAEVVVAAGGGLHGAASPVEAVAAVLVGAAACVSLRTRKVFVTHDGGIDGRRRGGTWIRRVGAGLDRIRGLYSYATLAGSCIGYVTLKLDVAIFTPALSP